MNALVHPLQALCGLTQEQFAAKLGVTVVTINRWENYRTKPMPLARRQLRRAMAYHLLEQFFPKNTAP